MVILAALPAHDVPLRPGAVLIDHRVLCKQGGKGGTAEISHSLQRIDGICYSAICQIRHGMRLPQVFSVENCKLGGNPHPKQQLGCLRDARAVLQGQPGEANTAEVRNMVI